VRRGHDDGDAGLVVRAQKRGAVGGDDRIPLVSCEVFLFCGIKAVPLPEENDAAVVVCMNLGDNVFPRCFLGRIHMSHESDDGRRPSGLSAGFRKSRGNPAYQVAVLRQAHVRYADADHFAFKQIEQIPLSPGRRDFLFMIVRGRVYLYVTKKSFEQFILMIVYNGHTATPGKMMLVFP